MSFRIDSCRIRSWFVTVASAVALLLSSTRALDAAPRADEFDVSIVGLRYDPAERVSKFEFKISGGQVVGLPRIPVGWTLNISNDPSWSSEVSATAIVGAAFLQPTELANTIITVKVIPDELTKFPSAPQISKVTGYVYLYRIDSTRRIALGNDDFVMSPRFRTK